jgi:segregation and condensation protein B
MTLDRDRIRSIIESMLLVVAEPLPVPRIAEVLREEDADVQESDVAQAVESLVRDYREMERPFARGFQVEDVAGGLQLRTAPENAPFLRRLLAARPQRLTKAALETLAIIAYRQPVTKTEIESIRGVDVGAVLKALLDRDVIQIIGKKEEVGRPLLYGTTKKFLELFGLKSLQALPTLREYHELDEAHQAEVDAMYDGGEKIPLSQLLKAADFLMKREHDPDLDELDAAVQGAERAERAATEMLGGKENTEEPAGGQSP